MRDDEWQSVSTAPHACHVLACYFDQRFGEWVYEVALSPPGAQFTHWQMLPRPPTPKMADKERGG